MIAIAVDAIDIRAELQAAIEAIRPLPSTGREQLAALRPALPRRTRP